MFDGLDESGSPLTNPLRISVDDDAGQVELCQRVRSQLTQLGLRVLPAGLVGNDADRNLGTDASRHQGQEATSLFENISRHASVYPSQDEVLGVGAIEPAYLWGKLTKVRTRHREICGQAERRIGQSFHRSLRD